MNLLKNFSDYPFLIHILPQMGNLPQVKKHCSTVNGNTLSQIWLIPVWMWGYDGSWGHLHTKVATIILVWLQVPRWYFSYILSSKQEDDQSFRFKDLLTPAE